MAVEGNATTDLCYLIYSSTAKPFRDRHLNHFLQTYFDVFRSTVLSLGVSSLELTFQDLVKDFYAVSYVF